MGCPYGSLEGPLTGIFVQGSPRLKLAALKLASDSDIDVCDALLSAEYQIGEVNQAKRKAVSRQKICYKSELKKKNRQ
jgi:hypothetical protein